MNGGAECVCVCVSKIANGDEEVGRCMHLNSRQVLQAGIIVHTSLFDMAKDQLFLDLDLHPDLDPLLLWPDVAEG